MLLLTYAWKTPATFNLPVTSGWGFNPNWLVSRPWLRYSIRNDSVFCISCMCFSGSPFVSSGIKNYCTCMCMVKVAVCLRMHQNAPQNT